MAFLWDHVQERWLEKRFAGQAVRFESKVRVAGSALEIDVAIEEPGADSFFTFLSRISLFENKAPSEIFDKQDLLMLAARTLLFGERRNMTLDEIESMTQVVLCSQVREELRVCLKKTVLQPGIWEGFYCARLVVVEANQLEIQEEALPLLIHYALGSKLQETIQYIVARKKTEYYGVLWVLRRKIFQEVLTQMNEAVEETMADVASAVEEIGLEDVMTAIGLEKVIAAIGLEKVIAAIGLEKVIAAIGLEKIIVVAGEEKLFEILQERQRQKKQS